MRDVDADFTADSPDAASDVDDGSEMDGGATRRPAWWRLRWLAGGAAFLALAVAAGGAIVLRSGSDELPRISPTTSYEMPPMKAGDTFSLGSLYIEDPDGDVEILEVLPVHSANVEYLGAFAVWPRDVVTSAWAAGPGFPAPLQKRRHPAFGVVVPEEEFEEIPDRSDEPLRRMSVTAGSRILSDDFGAVNGVTLVWRAGDDVKREHFPQAIVACIAERTLCQPKKDERNFGDFTDDLLIELGLLDED